MTKDKAIREAGKSIFIPLSILQLIFALMIISSPIIWIWYQWDLAWKICLSGIILLIVNSVIYNIVESVFEKTYDKVFNSLEESEENKKSRFKERMDDLLKQTQK